MDNIKFSIILPVYNVGKYLNDCLNSLINQTYPNLEIICINDGSSDNSLEILQQYAVRDCRIKIINQENQGQGVARNNGINAATGDFISFIDPDDWVELDMYEFLNSFIQKNNSKVVEFNFKLYYEATKQYIGSGHVATILKRCKLNLRKKTKYNWKNVKNLLLHFKGSSCMKVYNRLFIVDNNIKFSPHKNGEDIPFSTSVVLLADKIDFIDKEFYIYRKRENSSTTSLQKQNMLFLFEQIDMTREIVEKCGLMKALKNDFVNYKMRLVYDADKKCAAEYRKIVNEKAKEYLTLSEYIRFVLKKTISRILRNIFNIKKRYGGTDKTQITILGIKFTI